MKLLFLFFISSLAYGQQKQSEKISAKIPLPELEVNYNYTELAASCANNCSNAGTPELAHYTRIGRSVHLSFYIVAQMNAPSGQFARLNILNLPHMLNKNFASSISVKGICSAQSDGVNASRFMTPYGSSGFIQIRNSNSQAHAGTLGWTCNLTYLIPL